VAEGSAETVCRKVAQCGVAGFEFAGARSPAEGLEALAGLFGAFEALRADTGQRRSTPSWGSPTGPSSPPS
jgi:hypothetical protein